MHREFLEIPKNTDMLEKANPTFYPYTAMPHTLLAKVIIVAYNSS